MQLIQNGFLSDHILHLTMLIQLPNNKFKYLMTKCLHTEEYKIYLNGSRKGYYKQLIKPEDLE